MTRRLPPFRRRALAALLATSLAAVAALGVLAAQSLGSSTARLRAAADGALRFNVKVLRVRHGLVTIVMTNPSSSGTQHGIAVEGRHDVHKTGRIVNPGGRSILRVRLRRGTYEFFCPVPGHKAAGMEGKLIVS
ncbi:MAG TPA: plastocyanin/azurin family copper-binding protein [Solirubrobacteraceae bacterium]|nr:plastocyanin/azurin family copper-binding protein [Solirubrobacteraceae bacterium]